MYIYIYILWSVPCVADLASCAGKPLWCKSVFI